MKTKTWIKFLILGIGLMDSMSGLLLMLAPALALKLMMIPQAVEPPVMLSFVGAFVFGVGTSYLLALGLDGRYKLLTPMLVFTMWMRVVVALFTGLAVFRGDLAWQWASVPVTDAGVALLQAVILWKGWLTDAVQE